MPLIPEYPDEPTIPFERPQTRSLREQIVDFSKSHPTVRTKAEVERFVEDMFEHFHLPSDPQYRLEVTGWWLEQRIIQKNTEFEIARAAALSSSNADETHKRHIRRFDKKCAKLARECADSCLSNAKEPFDFYEDVKKVLTYGFENLRGYEDREFTSEELEKFEDSLGDAMAKAHEPASRPCSSQPSKEEKQEIQDKTSSFVGKKLQQPKTSKNDQSFAEEEQDLIQFVKNRYFPYISEENDFAIGYPMTNSVTGEIKLFSRTDFNAKQRENRDFLELSLRKREEDWADAAVAYLKRRTKFGVDSKLNFIGPKTTTTSGQGGFWTSIWTQANDTMQETLEERHAREREETQRLLESLKTPKSGAAARTPRSTRTKQPTVQPEQVIAVEAMAWEDQPGVQFVNRILGRVSTTKKAVGTAAAAAAQEAEAAAATVTGKSWWNVAKKLGVIALLTAGLSGYGLTADPLPHPAAFPQTVLADINTSFAEIMDPYLAVSPEAMNRMIYDEQVTATVYMVSLERSQKFFEQLASMPGYRAFNEFVNFVREREYGRPHYSTWNLDEWQRQATSYADQVSGDSRKVTELVGFLAYREYKAELEKQASLPNWSPLGFITNWQNMGILQTTQRTTNRLESYRTAAETVRVNLEDTDALKLLDDFDNRLSAYSLSTTAKTAETLLRKFLIEGQTGIPAMEAISEKYGNWNAELNTTYQVVNETNSTLQRIQALPEEIVKVYETEAKKFLDSMTPMQKKFFAFLQSEPKYHGYFKMRRDPSFSQEDREILLAKAAKHFIAVYPDFMFAMSEVQQGIDFVPISNAFAGLNKNGAWAKLAEGRKRGQTYTEIITAKDVKATTSAAESAVISARANMRFLRGYVERQLDAFLRWIVFATPFSQTSVLQYSLNWMAATAITEFAFFLPEVGEKGFELALYKRFVAKSENLIEQLVAGVPRILVISALAFLYLDLFQWLLAAIGFIDSFALSFRTNSAWAENILQTVRSDPRAYEGGWFYSGWSQITLLATPEIIAFFLRQSLPIVARQIGGVVNAPLRFMKAMFTGWEIDSFQGISKISLQLLYRNPVTPLVLTGLIYTALHQPVQSAIMKNIYGGFTPFDSGFSLGTTLLDSHFEWRQEMFALSDYYDVPRLLWDVQLLDQQLESHLDIMKKVHEFKGTDRPPAFQTMLKEHHLEELLAIGGPPVNSATELKSVEAIRIFLEERAEYIKNPK